MLTDAPIGTLRTLTVTTRTGTYAVRYVRGLDGWLWASVPPQLGWLKYVAAQDVISELTKRDMKGEWTNGMEV